MVGAWLAPTSPYLPHSLLQLPKPAQRIGREGIAALGCGCGMVPGFTSRPRGGAWLASLPKSVINNASGKAFVLGTFFCPLGVNVWEGTTAQLPPHLIFLLPPGWFAVPPSSRSHSGPQPWPVTGTGRNARQCARGWDLRYFRSSPEFLGGLEAPGLPRKRGLKIHVFSY